MTNIPESSTTMWMLAQITFISIVLLLMCFWLGKKIGERRIHKVHEEMKALEKAFNQLLEQMELVSSHNLKVLETKTEELRDMLHAADKKCLYANDLLTELENSRRELQERLAKQNNSGVGSGTYYEKKLRMEIQGKLEEVYAKIGLIERRLDEIERASHIGLLRTVSEVQAPPIAATSASATESHLKASSSIRQNAHIFNSEGRTESISIGKTSLNQTSFVDRIRNPNIQTATNDTPDISEDSENNTRIDHLESGVKDKVIKFKLRENTFTPSAPSLNSTDSGTSADPAVSVSAFRTSPSYSNSLFTSPDSSPSKTSIGSNLDLSSSSHDSSAIYSQNLPSNKNEATASSSYISPPTNDQTNLQNIQAQPPDGLPLPEPGTPFYDVLQLARQGVSIPQIARMLKMGKGEVELIMNLYGPRSHMRKVL